MRRRWQKIAHWAVIFGGLGVLVWQMPDLARELGNVSVEFTHLQWRWITMAAVLGVGALMLYGELHRQLLAAGDARLPVLAVQSINFVENALSTTLPAVGNAAGFVYAADQLRRRKVNIALASWSLALAGMVATMTLLMLAILGLAWAGRIPILLAIPLAATIVAGGVLTWIIATHASVLRLMLRGLASLAHRMPVFCRMCRRGWATDPDAVAQRLSAQIRLLRPTGTQWLIIFSLAAASWALDFLSLSASVAALDRPVPWAVLVVGFLLVQGSIALQIFPGGAGLAEAGLLGALIASGVPVAPAAAIVLIYRLINWLGLAVLGWAVYAVQVHTSPSPRHRHVPELKAA